jgi:hypothetical protein
MYMTMAERNIQEQQRVRDQERASDSAARTASSMSEQRVKNRIQNPEFADKIRDSDLPEDGPYSWLDEDMGPVSSGAYATANLPEDHFEQQYFLNRNLRERHIVESNPGFLLKENPKLLAIAHGDVEPAGMEMIDEKKKPMASDEKRVLREAYGAVTALQSLGIEKAGLEGLTTATAEHRTVTDERQNKSATREKVEAFFG